MNAAAPHTPLLLFGPFDRHNLGDLLFPHVAAALLPGRELLFAGLAERDLRPFGGHRVQAIAPLAAQWGGRPIDLMHVGGEILSCSAWQAAAMLLPPDEAQATIAYLEARPRQRRAWVRHQLGLADHAPYALSRDLFPGARRLVYDAVGGVSLARCASALRAEVLAKLRAADALGVRDCSTLAWLQAAGLAPQLLPDPACLLAELFGPAIRQHQAQGEPAALRAEFPQGYLALQFNAEFVDDATLAALATELDRIAAATGLGLALFRAGAAPWHDELALLQRLAARLPPVAVRVFESLNIWDLCALIAGSRGYAGSSLHGRILAMAFALPRLNLAPPGPAGAAKQAAYASTWEAPGLPKVVPVAELAPAMARALASEPAALRRQAAALAARYRAGFAALRAGPSARG